MSADLEAANRYLNIEQGREKQQSRNTSKTFCPQWCNGEKLTQSHAKCTFWLDHNMWKRIHFPRLERIAQRSELAQLAGAGQTFADMRLESLFGFRSAFAVKITNQFFLFVTPSIVAHHNSPPFKALNSTLTLFLLCLSCVSQVFQPSS